VLHRDLPARQPSSPRVWSSPPARFAADAWSANEPGAQEPPSGRPVAGLDASSKLQIVLSAEGGDA